jgi:Family of unknown function (DUF6655)
MNRVYWIINVTVAICALQCGCASTQTSNTPRTAKEQMLLSNAIDQSLDKVDFSPLYGQRVFLDERYLDAVDKGYIVGSLRHRIMVSGGVLATAADGADVVMEVRSGGVGTDSAESFVGIPKITLPGMLTLPEIRLAERKTQLGYAKLGLVTYDANSGQVLGHGGMSLARSDDNNWQVFGVGPLQTGSLKNDVNIATSSGDSSPGRRLPTHVALAPRTTADESDFRLASETKQ